MKPDPHSLPSEASSSNIDPRLPADEVIPEPVQESLFKAAQQAQSQPSPGEPPAITRDPAEPPGLGGISAPRLLPEDEEAHERTAAEAGLEAAADEQEEVGRRTERFPGNF